MSFKDTYNLLFAEISKMPVIDTHEHLQWDEKNIYGREDDVLREYLTHYMKSDVISAGLKRDDFRKVIDNKLPT
jgi:glucuronate isomerase